MKWLLYIALAGAVLLGFKALRASDVNKGVVQGEAKVQAQWDAQKAVDAAATLERERERSADMLIKFRNAERISDEQAKREALRDQRIANGGAVNKRLLDTIATLDRRDVSKAGSDAGAVALAEGAATARELFGSCNTAFLGLAAEADRLRDQVAGLQDDAMYVCRAPQHTNKTGVSLEPL